MTIQLRGGFTSEDPRLDALPQWDDRNMEYLATAVIPEGATLRSQSWRNPVHLDQGREGACVGFAWSHEAAASPAPVPGITNEVARAVYKRAQQLDPWPGEEYSGTSTLAGAKAARERGWIDEFRWALSEEDLALSIGYLGPAVLSIPWFQGMSQTDDKGFIAPTGSMTGRHAIECFSFARWLGYYRVWNSWGASWGVGGWAKIRRKDMAFLLASEQQGSACIPVTRAVPRG